MFSKAEPREQSFCHTAQQTHLFRRGNVKSNSIHWSTFMDNSDDDNDVIDFAMFPDQRLLGKNSFIVGCHMTLKWPMRTWDIGKNSSYITKIDRSKMHEKGYSYIVLYMQNALYTHCMPLILDNNIKVLCTSITNLLK